MNNPNISAPAPQTSPVKILYIAGYSHNGSTLLSMLLGYPGGFFSGLEFILLWEQLSLKERDRWCACRRRVAECPLWQRILQEAYGDVSRLDAAELVRQRPRFKYLLRDFLPQARAKRLYGEAAFRRYMDAMARLYAAAGKVTDSRVLVDDSKTPGYLDVLARLPFEVYPVHLVRDPRGVAASKLRRASEKAGGELGRLQSAWTAARVALGWMATNLVTERVLRQFPRRLRIRYEDFTAQPAEMLAQMLRFLDEDEARAGEFPFVSAHEVNLGEHHGVAGNGVRHHRGLLAIRQDERWRTQLSRLDKAIVSLLTFPLMGRYGYR